MLILEHSLKFDKSKSNRFLPWSMCRLFTEFRETRLRLSYFFGVILLTNKQTNMQTLMIA